MENNSNREKELETVDRERCERKMRKEKTKKNVMITTTNLIPDDRYAKRRTKNVYLPFCGPGCRTALVCACRSLCRRLCLAPRGRTAQDWGAPAGSRTETTTQQTVTSQSQVLFIVQEVGLK